MSVHFSIDPSVVDPGGKEPLHKQLASIIRAAIAEGHYKPGDRIEPGREFARRVNVSHPTVTRAFQELAAEGLVVRRVGSGTFVAAHVARRETERAVIGVFHYDCFGEFFERMLRGIEAACESTDIVHCPLFPEDYLGRDGKRLFADLRDRGIHGMVACPSLTIDCPGIKEGGEGFTADEAHRFVLRQLMRKMPLVLMDVCLPGIECDAVMTDNEEAAYQLARHLLDLGHRRIAFVTHSVQYPCTSSIQDRISGMRRALGEASLGWEDDWVVGFRRTPGSLLEQEEHVRQAVFDLLDRPRDRRPTAIMSVNDTFAPLVLRCLAERGVCVPEEMSVTGFDDLAHAAQQDPPLTTVAQPLERIGRQAVRLLARRFREPARAATHVELDGRLVVRQSTSSPPGKVGLFGEVGVRSSSAAGDGRRRRKQKQLVSQSGSPVG